MRFRSRSRRVAVPAVALAALVVHGLVWAQSRVPEKRPTVPPPRQWDDNVLDKFFANALDRLVGDRPDFGATRVASSGDTSSGTSEPALSTNVHADGFAWSSLIGAETLENEIKANTTALATVISNPGRFKGGTYKEARRMFSVSAVMLAIVSRYDGEVRWQDKATLLYEGIGHAGFNCKVGTDQSFNEAKLRQQDLADLLQGGNVEGEEPADALTWSQIADLAPLMQRMEEAKKDRLLPWTAGTQDFNAHKDEALREAQLLAAFSQIIQDEGYELAADEAYKEYCRQLQAGAQEVVEALKAEDINRAQEAMGTVTKACDGCHVDIRG